MDKNMSGDEMSEDDYAAAQHRVRIAAREHKIAKRELDAAHLEVRDIKMARSVKLADEGLAVSDHAVLRYLERICGVDVEVLRSRILEEIRMGDAQPYEVHCGDFVGLIREDGKNAYVVTTIMTPKERDTMMKWRDKSGKGFK